LTPAKFACYKPITRQCRERRTSFQPRPISEKSSSQSPHSGAREGAGTRGIAAHEEATMLERSQQIAGPANHRADRTGTRPTGGAVR